MAVGVGGAGGTKRESKRAPKAVGCAGTSLKYPSASPDTGETTSGIAEDFNVGGGGGGGCAPALADAREESSFTTIGRRGGLRGAGLSAPRRMPPHRDMPGYEEKSCDGLCAGFAATQPATPDKQTPRRHGRTTGVRRNKGFIGSDPGAAAGSWPRHQDRSPACPGVFSSFCSSWSLWSGRKPER